jgi:hypothetical protein
VAADESLGVLIMLIANKSFKSFKWKHIHIYPSLITFYEEFRSLKITCLYEISIMKQIKIVQKRGVRKSNSEGIDGKVHDMHTW